MSGTRDQRLALNALMDDARRGKIDRVIVWCFDRFARSVSHLLRALEEFKALGIDFVSVTEAIDTSTPMGKMVFTVLGAVAELERSLIVERVRAGQQAARARGKKIGRSNGYSAEQASQIAFLRGNELSLRTIAKQIGLPKSTVHRVLSA